MPHIEGRISYDVTSFQDGRFKPRFNYYNMNLNALPYWLSNELKPEEEEEEEQKKKD